MEGKAYNGPEQAVAWLRDQILVSWELLVEVRGGKVARWRTYTDRDEARRDAGLEGRPAQCPPAGSITSTPPARAGGSAAPMPPSPAPVWVASISAKIVWRIDPYLLRATRGRLGLGLVLPTALLETRGARSGARRRNGVIYFYDGERVTIVASKAGDPRHPAWFLNLCAHPDVKLAGIPMRATVVDDEAERRRLWALADNVFAPYAVYRRDAAKLSPDDS